MPVIVAAAGGARAAAAAAAGARRGRRRGLGRGLARLLLASRQGDDARAAGRRDVAACASCANRRVRDASSAVGDAADGLQQLVDALGRRGEVAADPQLPVDEHQVLAVEDLPEAGAAVARPGLRSLPAPTLKPSTTVAWIACSGPVRNDHEIGFAP